MVDSQVVDSFSLQEGLRNRDTNDANKTIIIRDCRMFMAGLLPRCPSPS